MNDLKSKSKKIHPFLVAIFPVLIIYSQNIGRVNVEELVLPMILIIAFSIGGFYLVKLIFIRDPLTINQFLNFTWS